MSWRLWIHSTHFIFFYFYLFIWPCLGACGILVPWPGIIPTPPAVEVWSLNQWTSREVPAPILKIRKVRLRNCTLPRGTKLIKAEFGFESSSVWIQVIKLLIIALYLKKEEEEEEGKKGKPKQTLSESWEARPNSEAQPGPGPCLPISQPHHLPGYFPRVVVWAPGLILCNTAREVPPPTLLQSSPGSVTPGCYFLVPLLLCHLSPPGHISAEVGDASVQLTAEPSAPRADPDT